MRTPFLAITILSLAFISGAANAKGCIKGAAVGGVAGHVAGKHGLLGAAAGCAVGRHEANKKDREDAAAAQANVHAAAPADAMKK